MIWCHSLYIYKWNLKLEQKSLLDALSLKNEIISAGSSLTFSMAVTNIMIASVIGLFIAFIYKRFFIGVLFQTSFAISIILVTIITTLVIMVISGNLALSLGMVGALSIIRFRSAIKDPLDIAYIFWAVATGISLGVSQYGLAIAGCLSISLILWVVAHYKSSEVSKLIVISFAKTSIDDVEIVLSKTIGRFRVRNTSISKQGTEFVLETRKNISLTQLHNELRSLEEDIEVRLLDFYGNN